MLRKIVLVAFALFLSVLLFGCSNKEKEQLKQEKTDLQAQITKKDFDISMFKSHAEDDLAILKRCQADYARTIDSVVAYRENLAKANAKIKKQKATIDSLAPLAGDSLRCLEQANAELIVQKGDLENALAEAEIEIAVGKNRSAADSAKADTMKVCFDVADHNANHRSWFQYRFGTGFWGLPFPIPAWLDTPKITSNPVVKPQPIEKPKRRHK